MSLGFGSNTKNTVLFTAKIDDGEPSQKKMDYIQDYATPYTFTAENVDAGKHLITFYVYKHRTNSTLPPEDLLLTFSEYVNVRAGYTSRMDKTMDDIKTGSVNQPTGTEYTITYKANYPSGSSPEEKKQFYKGDTILDASALGFDYSAGGVRFAYWTDNEAGTGTKYYAGDVIAFDGNKTLYAQWKKFCYVYYYSNPLTYIDYNDKENLLWEDTPPDKQQYSSSEVLKSYLEVGFDSKIWSAGYDYMFCGWDTKPDGSGDRYAHGEKPTFTEDTKLYAQWCKKPNLSKYAIKSARELNAIIGAPTSIVNGLEAEISIAESFSASGVTMISSEKVFNGEFTGATISGLTAPLFKEIGTGGKVINLTIDKSTISGAGAIAETNAGKIENCYVRATVTVEGKATDLNVGGMVGKNTGTITGGGVGAKEIIGGTEAWRVGGVAGWNTKDNATDKATISGVTISNCKLVTKGNKAYYAADAVGINGTLANTASSVGHTGYGVSSVYQVGNTSNTSFTATDWYLTMQKGDDVCVKINTASRESKIFFAVMANDNEGAVIFYNGNSDGKTPKSGYKFTDFDNALDYNWKNMKLKTYEWSNYNLPISPTGYYTLRIYNTKTGSTPVLVKYKVILE